MRGARGRNRGHDLLYFKRKRDEGAKKSVVALGESRAEKKLEGRL